MNEDQLKERTEEIKEDKPKHTKRGYFTGKNIGIILIFIFMVVVLKELSYIAPTWLMWAAGVPIGISGLVLILKIESA